MATPTNTRPETGHGGQWVNPEDLVCPECGEQVRCEPPGYWLVAWGLPASGFSHQDASTLCLTRTGGQPTEPVETDRR
jgi:protein-disulfide isomerase